MTMLPISASHNPVQSARKHPMSRILSVILPTLASLPHGKVAHTLTNGTLTIANGGKSVSFAAHVPGKPGFLTASAKGGDFAPLSAARRAMTHGNNKGAFLQTAALAGWTAEEVATVLLSCLSTDAKREAVCVVCKGQSATLAEVAALCGTSKSMLSAVEDPKEAKPKSEKAPKAPKAPKASKGKKGKGGKPVKSAPKRASKPAPTPATVATIAPSPSEETPRAGQGDEIDRT